MNREWNSIQPGELFIQVHITSKCNLRCRHCYVDRHDTYMSVDLLQIVLEQFKELQDVAGVPNTWIQLTGGEPLFHPDFRSILIKSSEHFPTRVLTNGTLIDRETAASLKEHCLSVQISFDGTSQIHDSWRGVGAFDAAFRGLLYLEEAQVPRTVRITVGNENQDCIEKLYKQLEPHIDGFNVSRVVPMGQCQADLPATAIYRRITHRLYSLSSKDPKIRLRDPFFGVLLKVDHPDIAFFGCSAGISGLCVTESGDIYPCRRLPVKLGNVGTDRLSEVYLKHPLLVALRNRELDGRCGRCEDRLRCGGSRCIAYALTADPLGEDPGCVFA